MSKTGKLCVAILGMGLLATCHQTIFTAPPGAEIVETIANPLSIPANGGVSVISAIVYDGTGQPVPDGTVVQFFTDLGRVDPQGRTNDGIAKVNLRSDGRSGEATVLAVIGGGEGPAPTPSASASASSSISTSGTAFVSSVRATQGAGASVASLLSSTTVATETDTVKVKIGTNLPKRILLSANPRNIAAGAPRFTTLTATVIDEDGNPVANIPVVFRIPPDRNVDTYEDSLDSHGLPVYTDNNGQVRDRLFTGRDPLARPKTIVVSAEPVVDPAVGPATTDVGVNF